MKGFGDRYKSKKQKNKKTIFLEDNIINQAFNFHLQGNIKEAKKYYQHLINQECVNYRVFSNYGILLRNEGKLKDAETLLRKAIELNPNFADSHSNLGLIFRDQSKLQDAETSTRKAIELNPNFSQAHYNLGGILKSLGNLKDAELSYRKAIELNPNFSQAHYNLGGILKSLGNLKDAELSYRRAIQLNPNFANAYSNLGNILKDLNNLKEAELSYRKAIELNPALAETYSNLGNILRKIGKLEDAESSFRKAIELNPDLVNAYFNLFHHYEQINNLDKLNESLDEFKKIDCIENEQNLFQARLNFRNKKYHIAKEFIDNISSEWIEKNNNSKKIIFWNFKAFIEDKIGNYDLAYSCFENSQKDQSYESLKKNSYLEYINSYKENFINKTTNFQKCNHKIKEYKLAFLIGFPRSGTTLLDTILRSHRNIEVIEEKPLISTIEKLVKEKFNIELGNLSNVSGDNIKTLKLKYFELLEKYKTKNADLFIDKLPLNTVSLPLINLIFPNAKIIFTHRHPYDTILSCFQQSFKPNLAMSNLVSLQSTSIMYDQVMDAWDIYIKNLDFDYMTSKYEDLIEDFDSHTLKILEFLDMEWDANIKKYRKTAIERGKINTPSSSQVTQPLYTSSIKKWKNYEKYFDNCHQYLDKWLSYFNY